MSILNSVIKETENMGDHPRSAYRDDIFAQLSSVQSPIDFQTALYLIDPRVQQLNEVEVEQQQLIRKIASSIINFRKQNASVSQSFLDLCKKIENAISSRKKFPHQWKYYLLFLIDEARKESCLYELFPPDQFEELHTTVIQLRRPNYYEIGYSHRKEMVSLRQEAASSEHEQEFLLANQMFESSTHVQRTTYLFRLLMTYPKDFLGLMKSRLLFESLQSLEQTEHSRERRRHDRSSSQEQQLEISLLNNQLQRIPRPNKLSIIKRKIRRLLKNLLLIFFVSCLIAVAYYSFLGLFKNTTKGAVLLTVDEQDSFSAGFLLSKEFDSIIPPISLIKTETREKDIPQEASVLGTNLAKFDEELKSVENITKRVPTATAFFRFIWKGLHQMKVLIPLLISIFAIYWYISRAIKRKKECAHHIETGRHRWFLRSSCPYCQAERASRRSH